MLAAGLAAPIPCVAGNARHSFLTAMRYEGAYALKTVGVVPLCFNICQKNVARWCVMASYASFLLMVDDWCCIGLRMTSPLSFNRSATGSSAQNVRTDSDASTAQTSTETETSREQPSLASVMVQFSDEVRKRIDATMRAKMSKLNNADQDLARGRIEQIKRRIQMLKMMLLSLAGQSVPPGVLREMRQLAAELGQAAKTLSGGSSGEAADTAGGDQSGMATESGGAAALSAATATSSTSSTSTAGDSASAESAALGNTPRVRHRRQKAVRAMLLHRKRSNGRTSPPRLSSAAQVRRSIGRMRSRYRMPFAS